MSAEAARCAMPAAPKAATTSHSGAVIRRQCACGAQALRSGGTCKQCGQRRRVQARLGIGAAHDPLELEADRVAAQVLSDSPGAGPDGTTDRPQIRRASSGGAVSGEAGMEAPASVERVLAGAGSPLEPAVRGDMEARFGHDFSRVRVHRDSAAARSAREIGASAYTLGSHIVFDQGRYSPASGEGRHLLAHELTHVVQQAEGPASIRRKIDIDDFEVVAFDSTVLQKFLAEHGPGNIENDSDSDEKARTILRGLLDGGTPPSADVLLLLIEEMVAGWTGSDDEHAILSILRKCQDETSGWPSLDAIFSRLNAEDLDDEFQGEEETELRKLYDEIFVDGAKGVVDDDKQVLKPVGKRGAGSTAQEKKEAGGTEEDSAQAEAEPARVPRDGEKDLIVLLNPDLKILAQTLNTNGEILTPGSPEALAQALRAIKFPIGTMYVLSHGDDSANIAFGHNWITAEKVAKALEGSVAANLAPWRVDFRGCRIGQSPPGMEKIRAALGAESTVGSTCWMNVVSNLDPFDLGDGPVLSPTKPGNRPGSKPEEYSEEELAQGKKILKEAFDSKYPDETRRLSRCILDESVAAYFRAEGHWIAVWYRPVGGGGYDSRATCENSMGTPEVLDPTKVTKAQASVDSRCRKIEVRRPKP